MSTIAIVFVALLIYSLLFLLLGYILVKAGKKINADKDKTVKDLLSENIDLKQVLNRRDEEYKFYKSRYDDQDDFISKLKEKLRQYESIEPEKLCYEKNISMRNNFPVQHGEVTSTTVFAIRDLIKEAGEALIHDYADIRFQQYPADKRLKQFSIRLTIPKPQEYKYERKIPYQQGPKFSKEDIFNHSKQAEVAWKLVDGSSV